MNTTDPQDDVTLLEPREKPKVNLLLEMMSTALVANSAELNRMANNKYIRDCAWEGKSFDGKKGKDDKNRNLGPWEGSSDVTVRLADMIIIEHSLMLMMAVLRSNVTATPQEMEDQGAATLAVGLLGYYFNGQMSKEVWSVIGRAVDGMLTYGHSVIRVGWRQSFRMVQKEMTYETLLDWAKQQQQQEYAAELAAMVEQQGVQLTQDTAGALAHEISRSGDEAVAQVQAALSDRTARPQLVKLLEAWDPAMCDGEPLRLATALQAAREATFRYYATELVENRPQWRALTPWVDVFYGGMAEDLQDEPFIAEVQWVTKQQLLEMAAAEEWDAEWLTKVQEHPGRAFGMQLNQNLEWVLNAADVNYSIPLMQRQRDFFMLVRVFYKAVNKAGVTGVWETLIHDAAPESCGYHRLVDATDGQYPHVEVARENNKRRLTLNTGIPEEVESEQEQLKAMADARHDKTALEVSPPMKQHWKEVKRDVRTNVRPGAVFPERDGANTGFLNLGGGGAQAASIADEALLRQGVARRWGLIDEAVPPAVTQAHMEVMVGHLFKQLKELIGKTFALLQLHMDPLTGIRIAGGPEVFAAAGAEGKVLNVSREEIQGRYDFRMEFDPRNLNMEWVLERIKAVTDMIIPIDNVAAVDRAAILRMALAMIDPRLAAQVKSAQTAAADEAKDEQLAWAIIASGAEPPMQEGVDFKTRLAFWQQLLQQSPRAAKLIQEDPMISALAQNRLKYLQMGAKQEENKRIGRIGAEPVMGGVQLPGGQ